MHTTVSTKMWGGQVCIYHSYQQSIHIPSFPSLLPNSFLFHISIGLSWIKEDFPLSKDSKAIQEATPDSSRCLVFEPPWYLDFPLS